VPPAAAGAASPPREAPTDPGLAAERRAAFSGPPHVAVSVALRSPGDATPPTARALAAWALFGSRLFASGRFRGAGGPLLSMAPLDRPETITFSSPVLPGEAPDDALRRVEGWVKDALASPVGDADRARASETFGFLLGWRTGAAFERHNVYGVAFRLARSRQARLPDPHDVRRALESATDEDLLLVREAPTARVTLLPKE
jgi:hypothetical protein